MKYKSIFNIIKNYHWQSLFFKYWKILIIAFAVPMVLFLCIFFYSLNASHNKEFSQLVVTSALKSKEDFSVIYNDFENFYNTALSDSKIAEFLLEDNPTPKGIKKYETFNTVLSELTSFATNYKFIESACIYSNKSDYLLTTIGSGFRENHKMKVLVDNCIKNKSRNFFISKFEHLETDQSRKSTYCLTLVYALNTQQYNISDGILIINIDCSELAKFISQNYSNEDIYLLSNDGILLNRTPDLTQEQALKYASIYQDIAQRFSASSYSVKRTSDSILCYILLPDFGISMMLRTPIDNMKEMIDSFAFSMISLIIIMLLVILCISFYTSLIMYKSIANIISDIGISSIPNTERGNEISFISTRFLTTLKSKSDIEDELTHKVKLLKQSQALALQTQISPHFIFNTLNLVNLMIIRITQQNCEPAQIITLLSDIMYYSLNTDKYITTVDEELQYAQKYIQIEQIKYHDKFDFEIEVSDEVKTCSMVKFTLQPVLENCVIHGFKMLRDRRGLITLKIYAENSTLHISITDNGNGMPSEMLNQINEHICDSTTVAAGKHIGLSNVNQRIRLLFGDQYGIKISTLEQGLKVEILQPLIYSD